MQDLLISGIQHFIFCRRQWALIHIEQQWQDNYLTLAGKIIHNRSDNAGMHEKRHDLITISSMQVYSDRLNITGVCDMVELHRSSAGVYLPRWADTYNIFPIEYKRGKNKADHSDILQLTAEAVCLEEMTAAAIPEGVLFYHATRRRQIIQFTDELRAELEQTVKEMHQLMEQKYTPKVKRKPKCQSCSLKAVCLPELGNRKAASTYMHAMLEEINDAEIT